MTMGLSGGIHLVPQMYLQKERSNSNLQKSILLLFHTELIILKVCLQQSQNI